MKNKYKQHEVVPSPDSLIEKISNERKRLNKEMTDLNSKFESFYGNGLLLYSIPFNEKAVLFERNEDEENLYNILTDKVNISLKVGIRHPDFHPDLNDCPWIDNIEIIFSIKIGDGLFSVDISESTQEQYILYSADNDDYFHQELRLNKDSFIKFEKIRSEIVELLSEK